MKKKKGITIEITRPLPETAAAIHLIKKFFKINKINRSLTIVYDYGMKESAGEYHNEHYEKNKIFINPLNCGTLDDQFASDNEPYYPGYVADVTIFGVTIHEFCHYLHFRIYPSLVQEYKIVFPTERFYLNTYSNNELFDEIAEVMTLYITNPYLLKLISKKHWGFFHNKFKSPVDCSFRRAKQIYDAFPILVKEHLKKTFHIVFNLKTNKFERTETIKDERTKLI